MGFLQLHIHLSAQDLSFLLKDREKKFLFCVKFYATDCIRNSLQKILEMKKQEHVIWISLFSIVGNATTTKNCGIEEGTVENLPPSKDGSRRTFT